MYCCCMEGTLLLLLSLKSSFKSSLMPSIAPTSLSMMTLLRLAEAAVSVKFNEVATTDRGDYFVLACLELLSSVVSLIGRSCLGD